MDFKKKFENIATNRIAMMKIQRLQMIQHFAAEKFNEEKTAEIIEKAEALIKEVVASLEELDSVEHRIEELEKEVF